jgi:hypothetical protein
MIAVQRPSSSVIGWAQGRSEPALVPQLQLRLIDPKGDTRWIFDPRKCGTWATKDAVDCAVDQLIVVLFGKPKHW